MKRYRVTEVELKRYKVLMDVEEGRINLKAASEMLGLSYRQTLRLNKRFQAEGLEGLFRRVPQRPPNLRITSEVRQQILCLRRNLYKDFNLLHFRDKLTEVHGIKVSYERLRQILIDEGLHEAKKKRKVYRRRRRMPKAGMLVQMDSSQHRETSLKIVSQDKAG